MVVLKMPVLCDCVCAVLNLLFVLFIHFSVHLKSLPTNKQHFSILLRKCEGCYK